MFVSKKITKTTIASLFVMLCGFAGFNAHAIVITPSTAGIILGSSLTTPTTAANCEAGCIYDAFNINGGVNNGSLSLLYKSDVSGSSGIGSDSGSFAASYNTTFSGTQSDPSNALIDYISGASIVCPDCYLAIKDGNHAPTYYFYDLASWNGTDDIVLRDFWPKKGAISHVSIWGAPSTNIPEPGIVLLLGIGLLGLLFTARRQQQSAESFA
ncbi:MAG: PEP-CTERM sorting domain-containing protein [Nitrosomonas sp.]|nr:PEP-CTERM sorting domain-containing protein [Nitrosomonas sp.]